jgi:putative ATP-dependent endonuclease of the OLD family
MVSEHISNITAIPDYILDAIVFACPTLNQSILLTVAKYRLNKLKDNHYTGDETDYNSLLEKIILIEDIAKALEFFTEELPDDVLSKLISKLNA